MPNKVYEVIRVVDGDTIKVFDNGSPRSLRLTGIDTPEKAQGPHAQAAADLVKSWFQPGDPLEFMPAKAGFQVRYRRRVGYVFKNGVNLNVALVAEGLAFPFPVYPNFEYVNEIRRASLRARRLRKGVYDPAHPVQVPYEYRLRGGQKPLFFVGHLTTRKYYPPDEYPRVNPQSRVFFAKESQAVASGYRLRKTT
jgi:endonuclease YncB( thermonuclease family)